MTRSAEPTIAADSGPVLAREPERTRVLGILNVTPDSFSDGGRFTGGRNDEVDPAAAVAEARSQIDAGADALDVGGESTRPGSDEVSVEVELSRVTPLLEGIRAEGLDPVISIDTRRAPVAERAIELGATIVNDTAALRDDPELASLCAERDVYVVLMHRQGVPKTMQARPRYDDVVDEVIAFLDERVEFAIQSGIDASRIVVDPGLGFGKSVRDNYELASALDRFTGRWPTLVGASRKSFLGAFDPSPAVDRLVGSLAFAAAAVQARAQWLRVHDVEATVRFVRTLEAIREPARTRESEGRA